MALLFGQLLLLLMSHFTLTLQSLLELEQRSQCRATIQDLNEVETVTLSLKSGLTALTK